jgi:hypothetical protein
MSTVDQLKEQFETFLLENDKFESGNASAGTRARKALQEVAKLVKQRRGEITEVKNTRKEAKTAVVEEVKPAKVKTAVVEEVKPAKVKKAKAA